MEKLEGIALAAGRLEELRNIPQFLYIADVGREEAMALRNAISRFIEEKGRKPEIDVVLHSLGGDPNAAYVIIKTLRKFFGRVNMIIPAYAKSAATLLALGASEIILDSFGEFGPLDTQVARERNDSPTFQWQTALVDESSLEMIEKRANAQFFKLFTDIYCNNEVNIERTELSRQVLHFLAEFYSPLLHKVDPYQLGENNRNLGIAETYGGKILALYSDISVEQGSRLVHFLAHQCPHHGYIIDDVELRNFGMHAKHSSEISVEYEVNLMQLSNLLIESQFEVIYIGFASEVIAQLSMAKKEEVEENANAKENGKDDHRKD